MSTEVTVTVLDPPSVSVTVLDDNDITVAVTEPQSVTLELAEAGPPGRNAEISVGTGDPSGVGVEGELYLDTDTGNVWTYTA